MPFDYFKLTLRMIKDAHKRNLILYILKKYTLNKRL